jgi:hypothetical protein
MSNYVSTYAHMHRCFLSIRACRCISLVRATPACTSHGKYTNYEYVHITFVAKIQLLRILFLLFRFNSDRIAYKIIHTQQHLKRYSNSCTSRIKWLLATFVSISWVTHAAPACGDWLQRTTYVMTYTILYFVRGSTDLRINLQGVAIGNGVIDEPTQVQHRQRQTRVFILICIASIMTPVWVPIAAVWYPSILSFRRSTYLT